MIVIAVGEAVKSPLLSFQCLAEIAESAEIKFL